MLTRQQDRRLGGVLDRNKRDVPRRGEGAGGAPESILAHPPEAFSGTTCSVDHFSSDSQSQQIAPSRANRAERERLSCQALQEGFQLLPFIQKVAITDLESEKDGGTEFPVTLGGGFSISQLELRTTQPEEALEVGR